MRYLYLILVMTGLFLAAGCQEKDGKGQKHSVVVTQPEAIGGGARSQFSGTVKEAAEISLGFKTAGQIERICVKEGQYVRSGQLLAVLDQKDYALGVKASEAQYRQLKDEVDRLRKLYETQGISGNDYEKALAGLEQVEVNLQVNRNKLDYTRLYAPASGYINKVNFERAEMVNAGTPVFSLISQGQMEVEVSLPLWTYLHRGDIREATALLNWLRATICSVWRPNDRKWNINSRKPATVRNSVDWHWAMPLGYPSPSRSYLSILCSLSRPFLCSTRTLNCAQNFPS